VGQAERDEGGENVFDTVLPGAEDTAGEFGGVVAEARASWMALVRAARSAGQGSLVVPNVGRSGPDRPEGREDFPLSCASRGGAEKTTRPIPSDD